MKKLELRDICGYIPYGLHCELTSAKDASKKVELVRNVRTEKDTWTSCKESINRYCLDLVKPVLRPLSDLYKTITHNGKEVCPLVECAKIATENQKLDLKWELEAPDINACAWDGTHTRILYKFNYKESEFNFIMIHWDVAHTSPVARIKNNQYQLFDYLNELKIDYRNLIEDGLAVSVYDLEINPYK
jgi:hypothetical protein